MRRCLTILLSQLIQSAPHQIYQKEIKMHNRKTAMLSLEIKNIDELCEINEYKPLKMQRRAHDSVKKYLLVGGGYGGGKSCFLVNIALNHMLQFPKSRVLLARQCLSSLKKTTLLTLLDWFPEDLVKIHHRHDSRIELKNGSVLYYSGLGDDKSSLKKHLSSEFSLVLFF